ncbi:RecQ family ATP-dependent DNA helicase [Shimia thalassica]|uniref:RecQ family ATP-dependent DNA helicase n=1 Tax=Shimia thalassica TaxID=1715693 RepID=UPI002736A35D|nr:RecQ family ATP-dependent DNA helicase [Shimia thalassica]MDP2520120.1 RecQ family ATP-dependent DNA helicase [Shimia thalassica]
MEDRHRTLLSRCISIDLEVNPRDAKVFAIAAVRHDNSVVLKSSSGLLKKHLEQLEDRIPDIGYPIGHNFLQHDMEHLIAARPQLSRAMSAPIDTLWLNPLAFPRNPYHHLVKHYHDGRLAAGHVNDPELDAQLVFEVLANQIDAFQELAKSEPNALVAYHYLTTRMERAGGFDAVFRYLRNADSPSQEEAFGAIRSMLHGQACEKRIEQTLGRVASPHIGWPMAYALSWITVAGGDSVMPPWVRAQFREASMIVRHLRDTSCNDPRCAWCTEQNDPIRALNKWFGFDSFRPQPVDPDGRPLQERIVDEAMSGSSLLGILPTGTGKSLCYQVPALSRFDKIGALTVVISPLVALMADQVQGMERSGISCSVTINGMMSMPERQEALDKVRLGDAGILIISPEQLRSTTIRSVLAQREVGLWAIDEAHCVSKWGHDFRPDYRYLGRFIKEFSGDQSPAPIICLTATAKPEVVADIKEHFLSRVGVELLALDGGSSRTNLTFEVRPTTKSSKLSDVLEAIEEFLPSDGRSGCVVYCASRKETERVAEFLKSQGLDAEHFHAGLSPDDKQDVQERFRVGNLRVIAATNAFGMGIDKPDIRLVVHADIPGSLENYLQEAGRAGRDREDANCVLLFAADDVERQFRLSASSRLARHEIGAILKALRRIDERTKGTGKIVATAGEIVRSERDLEFERDSTTDDTRVKTAVSWLEEATLVSREENRVQIFPSSLKIHTLDEAKQRLANVDITVKHRKELLAIVEHLMSVSADEGVSTDELCGISGLLPGALPKAMASLESFGIARNDVAMTVFIHVGVANASAVRLEQASELEANLIKLMQEMAPDADDKTPTPLNLAETCQHIRDEGNSDVRPDIVDKLVRGISRDGRGQDGGRGNIRLRKVSRNTLRVTLERPWKTIFQTVELRWQAASLLLTYLTGRLDKGVRGKDLQVETTVGDLLSQLTQDALLKTSGVRDMTKLLERSLLWLHEQGVLTLGKGMTVFRPAMTIFLDPKGGQFTQSDFLPLEEHYAEQTLQTHVMATYAETGLETMTDAARLSEDYFLLNKDQFMKRWMPGMAREVKRQTTSRSWKEIVEDLGNKSQQDIVTDDRDRTNVLVLAGPGSGKTRVLVHRIAYLLRVKREDPRGILVLAYNRHAAAEIRFRLRVLVGDDAFGVTISTCHSLAMKLVGASFAGVQANTSDFDNIINEAVSQLNAEGLSKSEAEAQRESLIQGYRWILVDEYQDVGPEEYALISAVAGRSLEDADLKLSLFAVGDDDQNIYAFNGASIDYIRRFEADYKAKPAFLIENYRSTANIIETANQVISNAPDRMKVDHEITINSSRLASPHGGRLEKADPVAQGRVQLLDAPVDDISQGVAAVDELIRISRLDPNWNWARAAVISRDWKGLGAVRSYAEKKGLKVEMANENLPNIWRLRETQNLISELRLKHGELLGVEDILTALNRQPRNKWVDLLAEGVAELARELKTKTMPVPDIIEWIAEWSRDTRGEQRGLLLLTAHRAKGLEFDHVVILNGGWDRASGKEDRDAPRRLFYVAMTRAQQSLTVLTCQEHPLLKTGLKSILYRRVAPDLGGNQPTRDIYQMPSLDFSDLSFAGRQRDSHEVHAAVRDANVGDVLSLEFRDPYWVLVDLGKRVLGRMAKAWQPPSGCFLASGYVGAIINWRKADNGEDYLQYLKRDSWETVLPELCFQPKETEKSRVSQEVKTNEVRSHEVEIDTPTNAGSKAEEAAANAQTLVLLPENRTDLDGLKEIMQDSVSRTKTWEELIEVLKKRKIKLVPKGGGLMVWNAESDEVFCKLSAIKFSYINLIRRYREGFPEHTHTWLVERALTDKYVPKGSKPPKKAKSRKKKASGDDDFDLIED